jgi:response regulator RpfG family c-di-GMP phosphodiesterase
MSKNNKITVLYVDDEMINLELFQMTFKNTFEILTAESGKAGLEIMQNYSKIQVVISDMKMPK